MIRDLINQLNEKFGLSLDSSDYSGYLFKKITNSTSIAINKESNQYHIDVTDINGAMTMFPVVTSSVNLGTYSSGRKQDFTLKLNVVIYEPNIRDLLSDVSTRSASGSLRLRKTVEDMTHIKDTIRFDNDQIDSYTYSTYSQRGAGQHQTEIGRSEDDQAFLLLRHLLVPNDYLLILKFKSQVKYSVFGIQDTQYRENFASTYASQLFYIQNDRTPIDSVLIQTSSVSNNSFNKIYFGPPGTGKSTIVKNITDNSTVFRVTFHPDTDYNSFIGAYKPGVGDDNLITYKFVPQTFIKAYLQAWGNLEETVYLVIEEINRGNCAQIFGDIFQLLDRSTDGFSEYSITVDSDLNTYLEQWFNTSGREGLRRNYLEKFTERYHGSDFSKIALPSNLIILATMNTSDQSLFPMDSAFKRRWDWEYVKIDYSTANNTFIRVDSAHRYNWGSFIEKVNKEILENTHSEDKQIGNWFVKPVEGYISLDLFRSKVMFYLWTELCKDEYQTDRNLFKFRSGSEDLVDFTFNDLFTGYYHEGSSLTPIDLLNRFMEYHNISNV